MDARDYFLQSGPTRPQWACCIFTISCLKHHVPAYRRENNVLKVSPQVAILGVESACLAKVLRLCGDKVSVLVGKIFKKVSTTTLVHIA